MELFQVPASHIDAAWRDGARLLEQACKRADREVTADQLKFLLARGERTLLGLADGGKRRSQGRSATSDLMIGAVSRSSTRCARSPATVRATWLTATAPHRRRGGR